MLLDDLVGVIELLKERIATHGASLRENETRTRMALIDPLLQALGWDVSDPKMVTPEYDVSGRKADYALLGACGSPSATVEAKKLGEPLASHRMQMLNYSNASGVEYAGLTDGDKWELYEVFKRGQLDERRILDISIAGTPVQETALKLLLLWRPNLASGQPAAANAPVLVPKPVDRPSTPDNSDLAPPPTPFASPSYVPQEPIRITAAVSPEKGWLSLPTVNPEEVNSPIGIRFPDSRTIVVERGWTDAWFQICEWLASTGKMTAQDCPIRRSNRSSRYLVHTTPRHSNDRGFGQPRKTTTDLFVERQYGPQQILDNARFLLDKFGIPVDSVGLRFE